MFNDSNHRAIEEYREYITIIDDEISNDDPQLQVAIEESLTETKDDSQSIQELLTVFQSPNISSSDSTSLNANITISRSQCSLRPNEQ